MATTDPYRLSVHDAHHVAHRDAHHEDPAPAVPRAEVTRILLWLILVISAVANMVVSYAAVGVAVNLACGAVTGLAATALVVRRLKAGRR
ncbi:MULTISPECIES: hypothetical protein [Streptomyces]|uniref:SpdD protein n=1 Tax=Streptomyces caniscabiei TaxID=2746961 RepID=A0ABU4MUZ4_9ACTN|nr:MULTISPECIES: hypothetical protein [Streptomyces]MBE4733396.1 hypothetical protein [Streptomyces caniscabiei]MBE4754574.1 hypothetical protein [Streptomyces caniscabiei]MBE4768605.1 hypothetical protein [Streptomyces caniscabiei]MBE4781891.1 hypothetical protein [Streptomyces caniscabiei]MBE4793181.1 hypothetical protein [Streptomyces caniscabiei]